MNLGFIGTGKIASSVISGICNSSIKYKKYLYHQETEEFQKKLKKNLKKFSLKKKTKK